MSARWTDKEQKILESSLVGGVLLSSLESQLKGRTRGAIVRKANKLGYGIKDGNKGKTMYSGITRREGATSMTTTNSQELVSLEITDNKSDDSISNSELNNQMSGQEINTLVVDMLETNSIVVNPKIVFELSTHIMQTQGNHNAK